MQRNRIADLVLNLVTYLSIPLFAVAGLAIGQHGPQPDRVKLMATPATNLEGYYSLRGEDGLDAGEVKTYAGLCSIVKIKGIYQVSAQAGTASTRGVGIFKDGVFAVGWQSSDGKVVGCSVYQVKGNDLHGSWASAPGTGVARKEVLTFRAKIEPEEETKEPPLAGCPCGPNCPCDPCKCKEK